MAYGLLSEDFLAACLILAGGELDLEVRQLIDRANSLESELADHFGVTECDFHMALFWLCVLNGIVPWPPKDDPYETLRSVRLRQLVRPMLDHCDVWFNDEGEHWLRREDGYREQTAAARVLLELAETDDCLSAEEVLGVLARLGWTADLPARCMSRGDMYRRASPPMDWPSV